VSNINGEAERTLGKRLNDGIGESEPKVGCRSTQMLLEEAFQSRLVVDQGDQRSQLEGKRCEPHHLTEDAGPKSYNVGAEGDDIATERLDVGGVLGSLVGEPLVTDLMRLFD
jgi:hypothetical protein